MTTETSKIKSKLAALSASFDDLEAQLEPLFSQTFPETIIALEPLQQARLQTLVPYLVYDLIFSWSLLSRPNFLYPDDPTVYLKTRGIDPKTHPVVSELERVRQYFEKINLAENPPAKRTEIDKAAATRFIKHAIAQAQWKKTAAEADDQDDNNDNTHSNSSSSHIPVKMTSKMIQRAAYEKEIKEQDAMETDDDELEVFEGDELPTRPENTKGKGKETPPRAVIDEDTHISRNKRRRPVVDPFAGYGDDLASANSFTPKKVKSSEDSPQPNRPASSNPDPNTSANTQISSHSKQRSKAEKKAKKKTKGLAT